MNNKKDDISRKITSYEKCTVKYNEYINTVNKRSELLNKLVQHTRGEIKKSSLNKITHKIDVYRPYVIEVIDDPKEFAEKITLDDHMIYDTVGIIDSNIQTAISFLRNLIFGKKYYREIMSYVLNINDTKEYIKIPNFNIKEKYIILLNDKSINSCQQIIIYLPNNNSKYILSSENNNLLNKLKSLNIINNEFSSNNMYYYIDILNKRLSLMNLILSKSKNLDLKKTI